MKGKESKLPPACPTERKKRKAPLLLSGKQWYCTGLLADKCYCSMNHLHQVELYNRGRGNQEGSCWGCAFGRDLYWCCQQFTIVVKKQSTCIFCLKDLVPALAGDWTWTQTSLLLHAGLIPLFQQRVCSKEEEWPRMKTLREDFFTVFTKKQSRMSVWFTSPPSLPASLRNNGLEQGLLGSLDKPTLYWQ